MRCKSCDYPLWSIRARVCPECGTPFAPSEFEFAPNAVRFQCPHCGQSYYGTDEHGHLVPRAFACVSCGEHVDMDEMILLPTEGVDERRTTAPILPWLDKRKKRTAVWRTIGMAMVQPRHMMDVTPVESSVGRAWWFYTLVMLLVSILSGFGLFFMGAGMAGGLAIALLVGLATLVVGVFGWLTLWGAVAHGLMKILGAAPRHTIGRTYQALCYSSGVMMPSAIPCVGGYLLPLTSIWWMVSAALAVPRAQGARAGRGAIAVVLLPVLLYVGAFAMIIWGITFAVSRASTFSSGAITAYPIYASLRAHASANNGALPDHAARLLADGSLTWNAFNDTTAIDRPPQSMGGVPIAAWTGMTPDERSRFADAMAAALPDGWAAHRLGHVVFTYNGVNILSPQDPGLWLFLFSPDPDDGSAWTPGASIVVMQADGTSRRLSQSAFPQALAGQNALRKAYGLPPLPNPAAVRQFVVGPTDTEDE